MKIEYNVIYYIMHFKYIYISFFIFLKYFK
jgi:hypothetical protein